VPEIGAREVLLKVGACGVRSTDEQRVTQGTERGPLIFGHEIAGTIAAVGDDVDDWQEGDRVAVYSHVPDRTSWYSLRGLYAQCAQFGKAGTTAGFEPAGGGFAEYVCVRPWVVEGEGLVRIDDDVDFVRATFVTPVNTCLKGIRKLNLKEDHVVLVAGAGGLGMLFLQLAAREGASVVIADILDGRLALADELGAFRTINPDAEHLNEVCAALTEGRGADRAIIAAVGAGPVRDAIRSTRPGAMILLFAQTHRGAEIHVDVADLCLDEKQVIGSYATSVDVADETQQIVTDGEIELDRLVSHRVPLSEAPRAFELSANNTDDTMRIVIVADEGG
jgi:L-iditol 2-dehydrogenase